MVYLVIILIQCLGFAQVLAGSFSLSCCFVIFVGAYLEPKGRAFFLVTMESVFFGYCLVSGYVL